MWPVQRIAYLLALATLLTASPRCGLADVSHVPGQMEASFLVNLFKFVAWPRMTETATICFLQPSQVQSRLEFGVSTHQKWAQLKDRTLVVKTLKDDPKDVGDSALNAGCQILYLDAHTADRLWPFPVPNAVLTASNGREFAYHGGMIQFVWDAADTYRIAINTDNVTRSGLIVSGALGTLADRVDDARFAP
jgi:YfiR/HmsC-like